MQGIAKKIAAESIIAQINVTRKNKEICKLIHGEEKYKSFIASWFHQLPGHQLSGAESAASGLTQSTTGVDNLSNSQAMMMMMTWI